MPLKRLCPLIEEHQSELKKWRNVAFFIVSVGVFFIVLKLLVNIEWLQENFIIIIASLILSLLLNLFFRNKIDNDNQIQDLDNAKNIIFKRDVRLKEAVCNLHTTFSNFKTPEGKDLLTDEQIFFLSSTDLFVEKAQAVLTRRGKFLIRAGVVTMVGAFFLLTMGFAIAIFSQNPHFQNIAENVFQRMDSSDKDKKTVQKNTNAPATTQPFANSTEAYLQSQNDSTSRWQVLIFSLFKTLGITAYIYVSVKLLISLSRSFFHEGLSLFERRHALRFGRMYIYLKKGVVSEKWLETFFQWNKETKTSFLDMKPEVVTETLLHKLFGVFSDVGHAAKNTKINTGF